MCSDIGSQDVGQDHDGEKNSIDLVSLSVCCRKYISTYEPDPVLLFTYSYYYSTAVCLHVVDVGYWCLHILADKQTDYPHN